jgi:resuscitation-promoting factor RpfB
MLYWPGAAPPHLARNATERDDPAVGGTSRLVALGVAAALLLAGAAWLAHHRTVTLIVDGRVQTVESHAATVGELLERAGVRVGPDDRVDPALDADLVDGMRVEVVHGREISVLIGDDERRVVVAALTVDEALEQLGHLKQAPAGRRTLMRPSRMSRVESGLVVELSDPVGMTLIVGDLQRDVITDEATVGDVLARIGVELGPHDRVSPDVDRPTEQGMVVAVERVEIREEVREEAIPFPTEERRTDALRQGQRREAQAGEDGLSRITEEVTLVNGAEEARETVRTETVREPRARVVEVGTAPARERVAAAPQPAAAEDAAEREPEPEEPAAPANREEGKASWYDNPYGGYTAAHRTLPRGSVVTVTNVANGRSVEVRINDRGPFVDGRVIDLNREAFAELAPPSEGVVRVRVEW